MAAAHRLMARVPLVDANHKGPVVNLTAWITVTTMIVAVIVVFVIRLTVARTLRWADLVMTSAMVSLTTYGQGSSLMVYQLSSIAFVVSINFQVHHGLGSELSTLSTDDYISFQRAGYASQLLYILSIFLGKVTTLILLLALAPNKTYRLPMLIVVGGCIAWAVISLIASAFQCSVPKPYLYTTGQCFNQTAFWDVVGIIDIVLDLFIMALPAFLVYKLQLPFGKKLAVVTAFSFRILAVASTIVRLVELPKFFKRGTDITFESWLPTMATLLEVFFGVLAACIPHLRPFMDALEAGFLTGVINEGDGRFEYGNDNYIMGKTAQTRARTMDRSQTVRTNNGGGDSLELPRQGTTPELTVNASGGLSHASLGDNEKDGHRHRSDSGGSDGRHSSESVGSKAMIIKTTKEWSVSYQDA